MANGINNKDKRPIILLAVLTTFVAGRYSEPIAAISKASAKPPKKQLRLKSLRWVGNGSASSAISKTHSPQNPQPPRAFPAVVRGRISEHPPVMETIPVLLYMFLIGYFGNSFLVNPPFGAMLHENPVIAL